MSAENGGPQVPGSREGPPVMKKPVKRKEEKVPPKHKRRSLQSVPEQEQTEPLQASSSSLQALPQKDQQQQPLPTPPKPTQPQPTQPQPVQLHLPQQRQPRQQKPHQQQQQQQQRELQPQEARQEQQLLRQAPRQQEQQLEEQPRAQLSRQQQQQQQQPRQQQQSQLQPQAPQRRSRSRQSLSKQKPKKNKCCYSSCCCKDSSASRHVTTDSEPEDDATHIASLTTNQSNSRTPETSSGCLSCCCKKKRRLAPGSSIGAQTTTQTAAQKRRANCKKCCKRFLAFVFSHVGLCSLVVAYSIMGGFLFQWLESSDEIEQRIGVTKKRNNTVAKLWNITKKFNVLHEGNWSTMADEVMREFQLEVYQSIKEGGWDGRDEDNEEMQWSFSGSLLYSVTVITTIGYGHIAPKTDMGRLVTMFYALIGIPLTLLCLTNIGSFFANCFRFLYKHICNGLVLLCCPAPRRRPNYHGSTSTMTTTASLKSVASKKSKSIRDMNAEYEESRQALRKNENPDISVVEKGLQLGNGGRDGRGNQTDDEYAAANADGVVITKKSKPKEEIRVPMIVSLIIITGYIFGGAVLFSLWEDDWNYLIGSYFCFVTLSTIGFGDYVFGVGSDLANNEKMIICAMYLVLGLSIIAMCFNLMQEEVRLKSRWLGAKLGIIEPKNKPRKRT